MAGGASRRGGVISGEGSGHGGMVGENVEDCCVNSGEDGASKRTTAVTKANDFASDNIFCEV
jgi:hypothetical protein